MHGREEIAGSIDVEGSQPRERCISRHQNFGIEMTVRRQVSKYSADNYAVCVVDLESLADDARAAEVFTRDAFRHDSGVRAREGLPRIARDRRQVQRREQIRVRPVQLLVGFDLAVSDAAVVGQQSSGRDDFAVVQQKQSLPAASDWYSVERCFAGSRKRSGRR